MIDFDISTLYLQACPAGFYCPESTGYVWQSCPAGTFSSMTGLANVTQCTQCTSGYYCDVENATSEAGELSLGDLIYQLPVKFDITFDDRKERQFNKKYQEKIKPKKEEKTSHIMQT